MKAKRFILMLLVMLMSVTGVNAQALNTIPYTIYSSSEGFRVRYIEGDAYWWFDNQTSGWIILKTTKKYKLTEFIIEEPSTKNYEASHVSIYGSNDATSWTKIGNWNYGDNRQVSINSTVAYHYYKIECGDPHQTTSMMYLRQFTLYSTDNIITGYGTEENPYLIAEPIDFSTLKGCQADFGSFYAKVVNDIDFNSVDSWESVDLSAAPFVLDGNCKELKNLKGTNGLFSSVNGATITNLGIVNANINGTAECSGGIAAVATNSTFTNCYVIGNFSNSNASAICGGLVGKASDNTQLTQCYSVTNLNKTEIRPTYVGGSPVPNNNTTPPNLLVDEAGTSTKWCDHIASGLYIIVSTGDACKLQSIKLWNGGDTGSRTGRRWKDVKVYGSSSAEGPWDEDALIKSFTNLELAANNSDFAGELPVNATKEYKYYKVEVLSTMGESLQQMSDMKFVVTTSQSLQLPVCGATDGSCTATLCYHYGSTPSAFSTPVEFADISSGHLAYLLNGSVDLATGPYYQKPGSDLYPHLNSTGDNYVYKKDDNTFSNSCTHRTKEYFSFKAPSCDDNTGHIEYYQCQNEQCKAQLRVDGSVIKEGIETVMLSMTPIVIKDNEFNGVGRWSFQDDITINNKKYYDVAKVSHNGYVSCNGHRILQYTFLDSCSDSLIIHTLQGQETSNETLKQNMKFYVNGIEREELALTLKDENNYHSITTIKNLKKYDHISVEFIAAVSMNSSKASLVFYVALENSHKPTGSHNIKHIPCIYDCMTGGYREYDVCTKCGQELEKQAAGGNTWEPIDHEYFLQAYFIEPTGEHDFAQSEQTTSQGLLKYSCQRYTCEAIDPEHFSIKNGIDNTYIPVTMDGEEYLAGNITIIDAQRYTSPIDFKTAKLTYSRAFDNKEWQPLFVPFDIVLTDDVLAKCEIAKPYTASAETGNSYASMKNLKAGDTAMHGTPYYIRAKEEGEFLLELANAVIYRSTDTTVKSCSNTDESYSFIGQYAQDTPSVANAKCYVIEDGQFTLANNTTVLPAQRWYLAAKGVEGEVPTEFNATSVVGVSTFTQPTAPGMRLKVKTKDGNVFEFSTKDIESTEYYRATE